MDFFEQVMIRVVSAVITIILVLIVMHFIERSCRTYPPQPTAPVNPGPGNQEIIIPGVGDFSFSSIMM